MEGTGLCHPAGLGPGCAADGFYHAFDAVEPGRCLGTRLYTDGPFAGDWSLVFIVPPCPAQCPLACRQLYRPLGVGLDDRELYRRDDFCHSVLGRHFVTSIYNRDYTVILGITIFYSFLIMMMNLLVDIIYPLLDPRITVDSRKEE